jgi:hypothetical protein
VEGDGDVFKPENVRELRRFVLENTDGKGEAVSRLCCPVKNSVAVTCGFGSVGPYVFGPPGSGSISTRYGSDKAKLVRKTLIPTIL